MKQFSVSVPAATFPVLSVTSPTHTPDTVGYLPSTYSLHSGLPPRPDLRPCSRVASLLERKPGDTLPANNGNVSVEPDEAHRLSVDVSRGR